MTITVQIGNSDDKLTQREWSDFIVDVDMLIEKHAKQVHFSGFSAPDEHWQNAAWVFEIVLHSRNALQGELSAIGKKYRQDSIAWTEGETIFI